MFVGRIEKLQTLVRVEQIIRESLSVVLHRRVGSVPCNIRVK